MEQALKYTGKGAEKKYTKHISVPFKELAFFNCDGDEFESTQDCPQWDEWIIQKKHGNSKTDLEDKDHVTETLYPNLEIVRFMLFVSVRWGSFSSVVRRVVANPKRMDLTEGVAAALDQVERERERERGRKRVCVCEYVKERESAIQSIWQEEVGTND
jgi:hypothetical protein